MKIEDAKRLYAIGGESREIALEYFNEDQLKERTLPKTWFEYIDGKKEILSNCYVAKGMTDEFTALSKLYLLKQEYNGGWVPKGNWSSYWAVLVDHGNGVELRSYFLLFKSPELRDQFAANFKELIEAAKPLLG